MRMCFSRTVLSNRPLPNIQLRSKRMLLGVSTVAYRERKCRCTCVVHLLGNAEERAAQFRQLLTMAPSFETLGC
jgi:hypothetical protein